MLNRYSSRQNNLIEDFLNPNLRNAEGYDRLAGYFSSSILEVAGEAIESVKGQIRIVCNSEVEKEDVETAKLVKRKLIREWKHSNPEEKKSLYPDRFEKLYDLLKSEKIKVRVMPSNVYGLVHAKAGVIKRSDGNKIAFIGSVNETRPGWTENYEMLWSDDSESSVEWVQNEFDDLWNSPYAIELCDSIIEDIGRIAQRQVISIGGWRQDPQPAAVVIESPMYRDGLELWNHQKYFVKMAFEEHIRRGEARYVLADEVGLGKTAQLALIAELTVLYSNKPALIIAPKPILYQWQDDLKSMFDIPSAVFDGNKWVLEDGSIARPYNGMPSILQCPRKIAIISHGLIKNASQKVKPLLDIDYECVIADEAHKARRKNLNTPDKEPEPNNIMSFLMKLSQKTKTMILATATPIQLHPIEGWDLLYILAQKSERILGSEVSEWRLHKLEGINYITGKEKPPTGKEAWQWIKDPLPAEDEDNVSTSIKDLRDKLGLRADEANTAKNYDSLWPSTRRIVDKIIKEDDYFNNYNPFIRFMVKRSRETLETLIDQETGKPYLEKIDIKFTEGQEAGLRLSPTRQEAYDLAIRFTELLEQKGARGFYKTLLLRRIGSSMQAGLNTAYAIFNKRAIDESILASDELDEDAETEDITQIYIDDKELQCLQEIIYNLKTEEKEEDPKYNKIKELLIGEQWLKRGCIIFSEYYDTARYIAQKLSEDIQTDIGLYAGLGNSSGVYKNGILEDMPRDDVKELVMDGRLKVLVGTDAAGEGLNLQALGTLINIDLPWNPIRLEQRIGRIRRPGQTYNEVYVYNLFYSNSIEWSIFEKLIMRIKNITVTIGTKPHILPDPAAQKLVDEIEENIKPHAFDIKYREHVKKVDWENIASVLNNKDRLKLLQEPWHQA